MLAVLVSATILINHPWILPISVQQLSGSKPATLSASHPFDSSARLKVSETYGNLPLSFELNRGQLDAKAKFFARGNGYSLFLTSTEAVLTLRWPMADKRRKPSLVAHEKRGDSRAKPQLDVLRMKLKGVNPQPQIARLEKLPGKSHYFIGNDPQQWHTDVAHYAKVRYREVYPGIDLIYYGKQHQLEYDLVVAPGADPGRIQFDFDEARQLRLDESGDLVIRLAGGEVRQQRPVIYQESKVGRQVIEGRYVRRGKQEVGFEVGPYDQSKPLIIDPILSYSTYLGGADSGYGIAVDPEGNAYVVGVTFSPNFPASPGAAQTIYGGGNGDAFVTKLNPSGTALVYSTYLGGNNTDTGLGITVDTAGNAYITGNTESPNFPTTSGAFQRIYGGSSDAFVTKLNPSGTALIYSTYLGGSGEDRALLLMGIAVDSGGSAYVTGGAGANFPTTPGAFQSVFGGQTDAFVTKLNAAGTALVYSTYLGGNRTDVGIGIAVDAVGNAYVTGGTSSPFPTTPGALRTIYGGGDVDAFVTKLNAAGAALVYSTYLGGGGVDIGYGIGLDSTGNAHVTGNTDSTNFPITPGAFQTARFGSDAFVTKLNEAGTAPIYSTYLGGIENGPEAGTGITVDAAGNAYVVGQTGAPNFPTTPGASQRVFGGDVDAFVTKLSTTGTALVYSTFLGGSGSDRGYAIAVDSIGNAYLTGGTFSSNFPTTPGAFQATGSGRNAFIAKLGADAVTVSAASYSGAALTSKAIVAVFGPSLATGAEQAATLPLPTVLAGTTVRVRDSAGTERLAPLYFASPNQINYQIPDGTTAGAAAVTLISGDGRVSSGVIQVVLAAPALFTQDTSGTGAAAAVDALTGALAPFSPTRAGGQPNIISFFGTGLGADATDVDGDISASVQARIDGNPVTVLYAGRAPGYVGLNQFNIVLPAGITSGTHTVVVSRNGVNSNLVTIAIQ
jgi:uncharacterized protein (TIGR03437 family)